MAHCERPVHVFCNLGTGEKKQAVNTDIIWLILFPFYRSGFPSQLFNTEPSQPSPTPTSDLPKGLKAVPFQPLPEVLPFSALLQGTGMRGSKPGCPFASGMFSQILPSAAAGPGNLVPQSQEEAVTPQAVSA